MIWKSKHFIISFIFIIIVALGVLLYFGNRDGELTENTVVKINVDQTSLM